MNKLRNETIFTEPNSPLGKRKISGIYDGKRFITDGIEWR